MQIFSIQLHKQDLSHSIFPNIWTHSPTLDTDPSRQPDYRKQLIHQLDLTHPVIIPFSKAHHGHHFFTQPIQFFAPALLEMSL